MTDSKAIQGAGIPLGVGIGAFFSVMPDIEKVIKTENDPDFEMVLRHSEVLAGGVTLAIGIGGSIMADSWIPLTVAIVTVVGLVAFYELTYQMGME